MNGNFVFKNAVKRFEEVIFESLNHNNYTSKDIDMLITHQANLRITQYIQKKLNIDENYIFNNIMSYGNTTSAINAIDFKFASGNIGSGTIDMYGVL